MQIFGTKEKLFKISLAKKFVMKPLTRHLFDIIYDCFYSCTAFHVYFKVIMRIDGEFVLESSVTY